jgi:hypothetical protein
VHVGIEKEASEVSRLVHREVQVQSWRDGEPECFVDGDVVHRVSQVVDRWLEMGNWWDGEGPRTVLRVLTETQFLFDLECVQQRWYIYRIWD